MKFIRSNNKCMRKERFFFFGRSPVSDLSQVVLMPESSSATLTAVNPNMIVNYGADKGGKPALSGTANEMVNGTVANFTLTDGHPFATPVEFTATVATYSRTMANAFGTVVLPYPVKSDETVRYYQLKSVKLGDGTAGTSFMNFDAVNELPANTPALYEKVEAEAEGVTLAATGSVSVPVVSGEEVSASLEDWTMKGAYKQSIIEDVMDEDHKADSYYYISNNKFWHATRKMTVNPFRAYFTVPATTDDAQVTSFGIAFSDDATGVESVPGTGKALVVLTDKNTLTLVSGESMKYAVYTTGGVQVGRGSLNAGESHTMHVPTGIYVVNGNKVVVR